MITSVDFNKYRKVDNTSYRNGDIIMWGDNNMYPQYLYEVITECSLLNSILNGSIDFTIGNDIQCSEDKYVPLIKKLVADRWYFGGFCFQVLYNSLGNIVDLVYIDPRFVRVSIDENKYYIYDDYVSGGLKQIGLPKAVINKFNPEQGNIDGVQMFYFKGYKTRDYYPLPDFGSSLICAETLIEVEKFHYNTISNNFTASAILNFKGSYSKETRDELERRISDKFAGAKNAGKFMLVFSESPTSDNTVSVERLQSDDFDTKYESLRNSCVDGIYQSLRAMPQLFGLNYSSGFQAIEYEDAFKLYNRTAIIPKQNEIVDIFSIFGIELKFIPFSL